MKYIGTVKWTHPYKKEGSGNIPVCHIRPDKVVFEVEWAGHKYDVELQRHGEVLSGKWKEGLDTGPLTSWIMYPDGDFFRLKGDWKDGTDIYKTYVDLQRDDE